jgi:hypothetical protein
MTATVAMQNKKTARALWSTVRLLATRIMLAVANSRDSAHTPVKS